MILRSWGDLPEFMKTQEVRPYWEILNKKRGQLVLKRIFDLIVALVLLVILLIPMLIIAIFIKLDSPGTVFYRQERVTTYGRHFRIHKFRTMVSNADQIGTAVTVGNDSRITAIGSKLRGCRLDELPQLLDVIKGDMSFVGTRPEAVKYVEKYKPEYNATLLTPAGITSEASIRYKDEDKLLSSADDVDKVYVDEVLPAKMVWNLESIRRFRFLREILTMFRTVGAVAGRDYDETTAEPAVSDASAQE
jgi:lipopolysaccharide/colanic/teichoic acid biosynthesis glycosyltransferase